jgi:site-specific recombinase XerD
LEPVPDSSVEQLVAEYRSWLVVDRGLAAPTVLRYEKLARRFLGQQPAADSGLLVANLTAAEMVGFLLRESERVSVGAVKGRVAELRSLLRFLHLKGFTPTALATAVAPAAGWHDTGIPVGLAAADVQRLLDGCDRASPTGIRNFAILMLVARLGLRSVEVARLELGDIDWRAGEIVIAGKARRRDRLPLPHDVGQALSAYLRDVRPATSIRAVFLMLKAPIRPIRADLVGDDTGCARHQAGLPEVGPHRPRHALATTAVCAKADLEASLMIVGVGLALMSQEARDDNTLLTLVGASPRVRRSLAAARAGVLTLLGAALAVPAGLLPIWGLPAASRSGAATDLDLVVPVASSVAVVVLVPAVAAGAAWAVTRPGQAVGDRLPVRM